MSCSAGRSGDEASAIVAPCRPLAFLDHPAVTLPRPLVRSPVASLAHRCFEAVGEAQAVFGLQNLAPEFCGRPSVLFTSKTTDPSGVAYEIELPVIDAESARSRRNRPGTVEGSLRMTDLRFDDRLATDRSCGALPRDRRRSRSAFGIPPSATKSPLNFSTTISRRDEILAGTAPSES